MQQLHQYAKEAASQAGETEGFMAWVKYTLSLVTVVENVGVFFIGLKLVNDGTLNISEFFAFYTRWIPYLPHPIGSRSGNMLADVTRLVPASGIFPLSSRIPKGVSRNAIPRLAPDLGICLLLYAIGSCLGNMPTFLT
eukprot:2787089-Pyramimonas_sp.AAC.1